MNLFVGLFTTLTFAAAPSQAPQWSKPQLKQLLGQATAAAQARSVEAQDTLLADTAGGSYGVTRSSGESNDGYARRALMKRDPAHPKVKRGTWLVALTARFYTDVSDRARVLARFERDRRDRRLLEAGAVNAGKVARQLAAMIEVKVPGLQAFIAPLPVAPGKKVTKNGTRAWVHGPGRITIEPLDRATFPGDEPPADIPRTGGGSVRSLFGALSQIDKMNQIAAPYDAAKRRDAGVIRLYLSASRPALYLNELARAAREVKMHTIYVMTTGPRSGALRQIEVAVARKRKRRGKKKPWIKVICKNDERMQRCVDRLAGRQGDGRLLLVE